MSEWVTCKLADLNLDVRNFRTGDQDGQPEAIHAIIDDQRIGLVNLAEDALKMRGLSPGEPIWVVPDDDDPGKLKVIEGNRRITALKVMENPHLAAGTLVAKQFARLGKLFAENPIRQIEARQFNSEEEAQPWIDRRHMSADSGVALQPWKPMAKNRRAKRRGLKTDRWFTVYEMLRNDTVEWQEIETALTKNWTTVDRVLESRSIPELGIQFDPKTGALSFQNDDAEAGLDLLRRIFAEMASPDFEFPKVEKTADRVEFLKQFAPYSVASRPDGSSAPQAGTVDKKHSQPRKATLAPVKLTRAKKHSLDRTTLAPTSGAAIPVTGKRLNPMYLECRSTVVEGHRNAAALLLRVFIELSTETYLADLKVTVPAALKERVGKTGGWEARGIRLDDKIAAAITHLDAAGTDKRFDQARLALNPKSPALYAVKTLHSYFHNREMVPDTRDIKEAWDAWESYLTALHTALNPS